MYLMADTRSPQIGGKSFCHPFIFKYWVVLFWCYFPPIQIPKPPFNPSDWAGHPMFGLSVTQNTSTHTPGSNYYGYATMHLLLKSQGTPMLRLRWSHYQGFPTTMTSAEDRIRYPLSVCNSNIAERTQARKNLNLLNGQAELMTSQQIRVIISLAQQFKL